MRSSRSVALVALFTASALGSDFALAGFPNVKLVDTLVFLAAYLFGFRVGASVGILSELVWAYFSPWGAPGYIAPFLILGEVAYAVAGSVAARVWAGGSILRSGKGIYFGGLMAVCAFLWDLETNLATALIAYWPTVTSSKVVATILLGIPFMIPHEVSDFALGMLFVPAMVMIIPRLVGRGVVAPTLLEGQG